jgi:hypothetical protein
VVRLVKYRFHGLTKKGQPIVGGKNDRDCRHWRAGGGEQA